MLISAEMSAGPRDGCILQLDPSIEAVTLSSCNGGATYRKDSQGVWRFDEPRAESAITGDAIVNEAVAVLGQKRLTRMLALVAAEQAANGDRFFWCILASRLNGLEDWRGGA